MPREIAFRLWHKSEKEMLYESLNSLADRERNDEGILLQWTGLKDKNGKEIYEGDILSAYSDPAPWFVVEWDSKYARFILNHLVNGPFISGIGDETHTKHLTVIGSVYENPELLNK